MKVLLWEMRTKKNCTLMQLAKKTGIGKSTLNNIENGKTSPTLFQLETIAIALGCHISDLYESDYK
jgi:transcriptional regulator with XRE-family HTH domain